jgi:hypothetical protein
MKHTAKNSASTFENTEKTLVTAAEQQVNSLL